MALLKKLLRDQEYAAQQARYGLDAPEMTVYHREIILRKKFIKKLYLDWYREIMSRVNQAGKVLELGAGGGFLKEIYPAVITSDILPLPNCDMTINAYQLPFLNHELAAIVMINTLHHLGECEKFFHEAERTLKRGGKIVMLEPANTVWSRFVYKNFHHEPFNEKMTGWNFPSTGPMSVANGALPWMVFVRDRKKFQTRFPRLKIQSVKLHTPFRYLISGGLSYKSLLPYWMYTPVKVLERMLSPAISVLAMFQTIELIKE
ncbi:MAG: methyltransferase domain-containing protein [Candidatus Vogelbacteria bacterium]|nr:methyltransferase domain-containing protein [Candidatus Vogelbacteria bacterium]